MEFDLQLFSGEKTEQPTAKRRQDSRKKGQVARSQEIPGICVLLAGIVMIRLSGPAIYRELSGLLQYFLSGPTEVLAGVATGTLAIDLCLSLGRMASPMLIAALVAGTVANLGQVGFMFSGKSITPDFGRLNPAKGLQKMFSRRALVDLAKSIAKVAVIGGVGGFTLAANAPELTTLFDMPFGEIISVVGSIAWSVATKAGLALAALAIFDYYFQRREHEQGLKMTHQEVKQEYRETEGDPQLRSRIRQRQQQMSRQRMMTAVPTADVVITNPAHYAVALRYDINKMAAPTVVAKGRGYMAARIRELASKHGVPIVPNPPLARALYRMVEIGAAVPEELYQAVAEILALVYRLRGMRKGG